MATLGVDNRLDAPILSGAKKTMRGLSVRNSGGRDGASSLAYNPGIVAARVAPAARPSASRRFFAATFVSELNTITKSPP